MEEWVSNYYELRDAHNHARMLRATKLAELIQVASLDKPESLEALYAVSPAAECVIKIALNTAKDKESFFDAARKALLMAAHMEDYAWEHPLHGICAYDWFLGAVPKGCQVIDPIGGYYVRLSLSKPGKLAVERYKYGQWEKYLLSPLDAYIFMKGRSIECLGTRIGSGLFKTRGQRIE